MPTWVQLVNLACAICFVLALKGLSGPRTARAGNLLGAGAAVVAVVLPFIYLDLHHVPLIVAAIAVGSIGGVVGAQKVQMTQMPQMVALFNGVGGGAAALIALVELHRILPDPGAPSVDISLGIVLSALIGSVSFAGSMVAFAKLQELIGGRPITYLG